MPSGRFFIAPGITAFAASTHGALSHCMQFVGMKTRATFGYSPNSTSRTVRYVTPGGRLFSATQATLQALHPMQRRVSMTITQRRLPDGRPSARWRSATIRTVVPAPAGTEPTLAWAPAGAKRSAKMLVAHTAVRPAAFKQVRRETPRCSR